MLLKAESDRYSVFSGSWWLFINGIVFRVVGSGWCSWWRKLPKILFLVDKGKTYYVLWLGGTFCPWWLEAGPYSDYVVEIKQ